MAIFLRAKNSLLSRLKSLTTSLRLNHTLTEHAPPYSVVEGLDGLAPQSYVIDVSKWKRINGYDVGISRSDIPSNTWSVLRILQGEGFQTYLVGGCVRDLLLKRIPKDFDVITTAKLKQVRRRFRRSMIVGKRFPICLVQIKDSDVEVSSFETVARNAKVKEKMQLFEMPLGCDKKDFIRWRDSMHRDFTINSLFLDPFTNQIYDYANGMEDVRTLKLRTLIPAYLSFQEDCVRILRGVRIAGRLGLSISKDTEFAIREFASSVKNLPQGRIMMELNYMLSYGAAESTICLLQKFNLLELFLPFHAAYLSQQFGKTSSWSSVMLMKLFSNLDKLVSCDRPCHCSLWIGLLAFHHALVTNPQDAFVIWVFASVLYHRNWKEGVKFARENAAVQVKFVPEVSGFFEFKSDEQLSSEVSHLAALVQDSVGALVDADILVQSMCKYPVSLPSYFVFVPKKTGNHVAQLFDFIVRYIASDEEGRKSFMIDYKLLQKGDQNEIRIVLGKIIMETLSGGLAKGKMGFAKEEQDVIEDECLPKLSDIIKHCAVVQKDEKSKILPFNPECKKKMPKKQEAGKLSSLLEEVAMKEFVTLEDVSQKMAKKHPSIVETSQLPEGEQTTRKRNTEHATVQDERCQGMSKKQKKLVVNVTCNMIPQKETIQQKNKSGRSNLSSDEKVKCLKKKDHHVSSEEMAKKNSRQPLLSGFFRR